MPECRLVLLPNWMGDAVMAEPALRALARAQPEIPLVGAGRARGDDRTGRTPGLLCIAHH